jgi:dTDP-4-amino-4,6-dideoxygalactose transaminase
MNKCTITIPVADPGASYRAYKDEIDSRVAKVMQSGWYIHGETHAQFEREFSNWVGINHCMGVANGTDALLLALRALSIGPGDEVATVGMTATATVAAIVLAGATPVLVDIDSMSMTMHPEKLAETMKARPGIRAILPVHLYGHPAAMGDILSVANDFHVPVIEDCAQAHGAQWESQVVGTFGAAGAFSFYPTKNLGALGDAGAVLVQDDRLAEKIRMLRQYGWRERYISEIPGMNSRLDEIQAAVLLAKLPGLNADNARRRQIAAAYNEGLADLDLLLPVELPGARHVYHQYTLRTPWRNDLRKFLAEQGVGASVLYPGSPHQQAGYQGLCALGAGGLPVTEAACEQVLCLPVYPELKDAQVEKVAEAVSAWVKKRVV